MRDFFDASFAISVFVIVTIITGTTLSTRAATVEGSFETLPLQHTNYTVARAFVADTQFNPDNLTVFSKMSSFDIATTLNLPKTIRMSLTFSTLLEIDTSEAGGLINVQLSGLSDLTGNVTVYFFDDSFVYQEKDSKITTSIGAESFLILRPNWIVFATVGRASAAANSPLYNVVDQVATPIDLINRGGHIVVSDLPPAIIQQIRIGQTVFVDGQDIQYLIPSFSINPISVGASTTSMVATYFQEPCLITVDII